MKINQTIKTLSKSKGYTIRPLSFQATRHLLDRGIDPNQFSFEILPSKNQSYFSIFPVADLLHAEAVLNSLPDIEEITSPENFDSSDEKLHFLENYCPIQSTFLKILSIIEEYNYENYKKPS